MIYHGVMTNPVDFILNIDNHLVTIVAEYGVMAYVILFGIVFVETGVIVMPLLPGDSLLFAAGALAAVGSLDIKLLLILCFVAAVVGDAINYSVGRHIGARAAERGSLFGLPIKREHIDATAAFFGRHGDRAIIFARFMPIMRTFAPFVAGIGGMDYRRFAKYNVLGGALWVGSFLTAGYFFGNIPAVQENFTHVILVIIGVSMLPPLIEWFHARRVTKKNTPS